MRRRTLSDQDRERNRKSNLRWSIHFCSVGSAYIGSLLGSVARASPDAIFIEIVEQAMVALQTRPWHIFPTDIRYVGGALLISLFVDAYLWEASERKKGIVTNPNGDAAFETNFAEYDKEFVLNPTMIGGRTYRNEEYKKIICKRKVSKEDYARCFSDCQIFADKVALSLDGKWSQRNSNAIVFGASGAGKSRYFLNPNLLQANACYVITDPSGDIMQGYGAFLEKEGYIVKCLNVDDMTKSCRFNPLYYIRKISDIPIIVNTLMENTQKSKNSGGDGDFWLKTTQALLCAIIGYLYEVEPIERRNFSNVLEMLRKARVDEMSTETEITDFDSMFQKLGERNPASYAFKQYETYRLAPKKTALNILISTSVLISQYIDIPEFNNLTYKDEMELDKIGAAKEIVTPDGEIREGECYQVALFLCIPQGDTTYNWLTAMLYSVLFNLLYHQGTKRQAERNLGDPELAMPVRCLIDECANVGKIPNLSEKLATCRKYRLSIVPIFQNFSQIVKVYGKEDANSIMGNCDTMLFLGGADSDTLKIVCERMGKESIKTLTTGTSRGGRNVSNTTNVQNVGRELMSRIQIEQMSNTECLVFIRALKPFRVKKYRLTEHPNYRYTAEADPEHYSYRNPFCLSYNEAEIESIRIKGTKEEGYTLPREVASARLKALQAEKNIRRQELAEALVAEAEEYIDFFSGQKTKEQLEDEKTKTERKQYREYLRKIKNVWQEALDAKDTITQKTLQELCSQYQLNILVEEQQNSSKSEPKLPYQPSDETKGKTEVEAQKEKRETEINIQTTTEEQFANQKAELMDAYNPTLLWEQPDADKAREVLALIFEEDQ